MAVVPIVRYMILCEDWSVDPSNARRVNIQGLLTNIDSIDEPPFPLLFPEICVFLALTEGRGAGTAQIICNFEDTGQRIFGTPTRSVSFGDDPLEVVGVPFRIRDCTFPQAGLYSVQFWYNDLKIDERPLRLR
jgi:hypothetical protein